MPTNPDIIEDKVLGYLRAVAGLEDSLDYEPETLPRRLPVTTLLFTGGNPVQAETGPHDDVTYTWKLSLYIPLDDYKVAQQQLKDLLPAIFAAIRHHPTADDVVDFLRVDDSNEDPVFSSPDRSDGGGGPGYLRKSLTLTAVLTET
jgi:hypothetical protein